jgi:NAD(P)-dependent dehydrogenase (short-subunit alcohol dehydrogenase family)
MDSLDHQATAEQAGPKNGIGTPQKIVKTVAFPLSGEAGYITGQSLRINGGVTRHI